MTSIENKTIELQNLQEAFCTALKNDDAEAVKKAFSDLGEYHTKALKAEFDEYVASNDSMILEKAGIEQFTSAELKSFKNLINTQKNATSGISVPTSAFPATFITRTLNEATKNSKLLQAVNITNTGFVTNMILDESENDPATWSKMGETIGTTNLSLNTISTQTFKLAKIILIPREVLDMGPAWIGSYIKTRLSECFRLGLETGIVAGDGAKAPLGMNRTRTKGTKSGGDYYEKEAVKVSDFEPVTYDGLIAKLVTNSKGKERNVEQAILVVNPTTLLTKVLPAITVRRPDGTYCTDILPYPTTIISSVAVEKDKAILGINKKYEVFISTGSNKDGSIEADNSMHFAEHMTAFKIFCYANGAFADENDFIVLDISDVQPVNKKVVVVNNEEAPVNVKNVVGEG